jgi:hypothetical protein
MSLIDKNSSNNGNMSHRNNDALMRKPGDVKLVKFDIKRLSTEIYPASMEMTYGLGYSGIDTTEKIINNTTKVDNHLQQRQRLRHNRNKKCCSHFLTESIKSICLLEIKESLNESD